LLTHSFRHLCLSQELKQHRTQLNERKLRVNNFFLPAVLKQGFAVVIFLVELCDQGLDRLFITEELGPIFFILQHPLLLVFGNADKL